MKRRAIIIGNMGIVGSEQSRYIKGVQEDLTNLYRFIRSDNGGAWNRDEIIIYKPNEINRVCLKETIIAERSKGEVDYWMFFFSGHGWADTTGMSYLELCPSDNEEGDISLMELFKTFGSTRLLLITDACRAIPIMESGGKLPTIKLFSDALKPETVYRRKCRELYNQKIMALPTNSIYRGHSCLFRETSTDSGVYGGEYIHAIIESAKRCIDMEKGKQPNETKCQIYSYPFIHSLARQTVINKTAGTQHPVYIGPKSMQPPFCVIP